MTPQFSMLPRENAYMCEQNSRVLLGHGEKLPLKSKQILIVLHEACM
jgi:hypothetical protein